MGYFLIKIPSSSLKCIGQIYPRYVIARPRNLRINFALSSDLISSPRRSFFLPRLAAVLFRNWLFVARVGGLRKVVETEPFRIDPSSKYLICSLKTRVILDGIEFWDRKRRQKANAPTNFLRVSTSVQIPRVTQAKLCKPLSPATLEFSPIDFTVSRAQNYGIRFRCEGNEKVVR